MTFSFEALALLVYNQLKFGLSEKAYQVALAAELRLVFEKVETEYNIQQEYIDSKGNKHQTTTLRIDIFIERRIILELKQGSSLLKEDGKEVEQTLRYKRITGVKEAYLINFYKKGVQVIKV